MENDRVAKFFIGTLLGKDIEVVDLKPQEFTHSNVENEKTRIAATVLRVDFIATIKTTDGEYRKILIEIQKARKPIDLMRFRKYLGDHYGKEDIIDGKTRALPITTIYVLGFQLPGIDAACLKVNREYIDLIEQTVITKKDPFIEALNHDCYVVQVKRITPRYQTALERLLSLFEQNNFINSNSDMAKSYDYEPDDENIKIMRDMLQYLVSDVEERKTIEKEQEAWRTINAMIDDVENVVYQEIEVAFEQKLAEKDAELERERAEKDTALAEKDTALAEKDAELERERAEKDTALAEKDAELERERAEKEALLVQIAALKERQNN
jgi:hypothetical protein